MVDSPVRSVTSLGSIFTLELNNETEQKISVSFVRTGTEVVVTFSEVYLTVLDIDCLKEDVVRETIYTEDHDTYLKGDKVKVEGFRACGWLGQFWEHVVEHRSDNTHSLSCSDSQKCSPIS